MRFYRLLLVLVLLFPAAAWAQGTITGKVVRMDTKSPLGKASVFLSNSSFGTVSNDDGTFALNGVKPGQYELIVTMIGFEDRSFTVLVGKNPVKMDVELMPRVTALHEVIITTPANWKINYEMFVKQFLGEGPDARKCTIVNPHDISLSYRKSKRLLEAWSDDFIVIENKALGYKVKFLLKSFKWDGMEGIISWEGRLLYQELSGSSAQKAAWEKRRQDIYYGSSMHFFRSLKDKTIDKDGFQLMLLARRPNSKRPPEDVIQHHIEKFMNRNADSVNYWRSVYNLPKYDEMLDRRLLKADDILHPTDNDGVFAVAFPECLYVMYTKKREETWFKDIYHPLDMPNYETSVLTLYKPYALFDMNGTLISAQSTLTEGTWSKNKIAQLLPVDYVPPALKN